ncbi:MAG TPA: hypothetical protein DHW82_03730 [Spirochaetia bacterium]|nr:hypothetical protein [Spirochaetia bacterium]
MKRFVLIVFTFLFSFQLSSSELPVSVDRIIMSYNYRKPGVPARADWTEGYYPGVKDSFLFSKLWAITYPYSLYPDLEKINQTALQFDYQKIITSDAWQSEYCLYNQKGQIMESFVVKKQFPSEIKERKVYEYDLKDRLTRFSYYKGFNDLYIFQEYRYLNKGKTIYIDTYTKPEKKDTDRNQTGVNHQTEIRKVGADGKILEQIHQVNGKMTTKKICRYNQKGQMLKESVFQFDIKGQLKWGRMTDYRYHPKSGLLLEKKEVMKEGKKLNRILSHTLYEYDQKDRLIHAYSGLKPENKREAFYFYDDKDRISAYGDTYYTLFFQYQENGFLKRIDFFVSGMPWQYETVEYDSNGNKTSAKHAECGQSLFCDPSSEMKYVYDEEDRLREFYEKYDWCFNPCCCGIPREELGKWIKKYGYQYIKSIE